MLRNIYTMALAIFAVFSVFTLSAAPAAHAANGSAHHVVFQVNDMDAARMNLALNNAANVSKYYANKGETVEIEIVAYGPGLHMLRADTSPVKDRLKDYAPSFPNITFAACGNTIKGMTKKEGKAPTLISSDSISVVPSGVVQLITRQDQGWHYIRP